MVTLVSDHQRDGRHHAVGFYDTGAELIRAVARFLTEGIGDQDGIVLIARAEHLPGLEHELAAAGVSLGARADAGRYRSIDAAGLLARFMRAGRPDHGRFEAALSPVLAEAASDGHDVRVFGEMVALLWEEGNVAGAIELEGLWNDLAARHRFSLYCGYRLSSLDDTDLRRIGDLCRHHTRVAMLPDAPGRTCGRGDECSRLFVPAPDAPRAAREFAAAVLGGWAEHGLIDDAMVVASELATNALMHANSPFRLTLARAPSALTITVRDASASPPEVMRSDPSRIGGLGLVVVDRLARAWGTRDEDGGKSVWAELARA